MKQQQFYLAYAVRGNDGDEATAEMRQVHVREAIWIWKVLCGFLPNAHIYCPHRHEGLFTKPYELGMITAEQILSACCDIVPCCKDGILVGSMPRANVDGAERGSFGIAKEIVAAEKAELPVYHLWPLDIPQIIDMESARHARERILRKLLETGVPGVQI